MRIQLTDISIKLGQTPIVHDVDLDVPARAFLAIVGPNGSGKTTLLRAIYQAVRPTSGAIHIDGRDLLRMPTRDAARLRAVVPQFQDGEVGLSALEVVSTGRHAHSPWWAIQRSDDQDAALQALQRTGASALADRAFGTLSGGERQRVLLARALAQQASTLLLDEPTNHLDARAQLDLLALLSALELTRVAVLHDLDHALAYADRIAVMHDGRLIATGRPEEVLTDALTRRVFGVRSQIMRHPMTGRPHLLTATTADHPGRGAEHET